MRMQGHTRVTLKYIIFEERDCSINSAYVSKNGSTSVLLVYSTASRIQSSKTMFRIQLYR